MSKGHTPSFTQWGRARKDLRWHDTSYNTHKKPWPHRNTAQHTAFHHAWRGTPFAFPQQSQNTSSYFSSFIKSQPHTDKELMIFNTKTGSWVRKSNVNPIAHSVNAPPLKTLLNDLCSFTPRMNSYSCASPPQRQGQKLLSSKRCPQPFKPEQRCTTHVEASLKDRAA